MPTSITFRTVIRRSPRRHDHRVRSEHVRRRLQRVGDGFNTIKEVCRCRGENVLVDILTMNTFLKAQGGAGVRGRLRVKPRSRSNARPGSALKISGMVGTMTATFELEF